MAINLMPSNQVRERYAYVTQEFEKTKNQSVTMNVHKSAKFKAKRAPKRSIQTFNQQKHQIDKLQLRFSFAFFFFQLYFFYLTICTVVYLLKNDNELRLSFTCATSHTKRIKKMDNLQIMSRSLSLNLRRNVEHNKKKKYNILDFTLFDHHMPCTK